MPKKRVAAKQRKMTTTRWGPRKCGKRRQSTKSTSQNAGGAKARAWDTSQRAPGAGTH